MRLERDGFSAIGLFRVLVTATLLLMCLAAAWCAPFPAPAEPAGRVIAVGDVQGDFDDFLLILQRVGVVDGQRHWIGGKATLVQVGDLLDRGPKEREVMDFLMSLEKEAPKAGGQVVILLGNHEVMNIMGDLRSVTPEIYASFADANSEKRQQAAYKEYTKWFKDHARLLAELPEGFFPLQTEEADWMAHHPLGFVEQREAFAPNGQYGRWLRERATLARIGDSVFLHGGIHPRFDNIKPEAMNTRIRDEIRSFDTAKQILLEQGIVLPFFTLEEINAVARGELALEMKSPTQDENRVKLLQSFAEMGGWLCVNSDGPLWFRGYSQWNDKEGTPLIEKVLQVYKTAHLVVGHTPQRTGRITSRFNGRLLLIDTGMQHSYDQFGRASALEIQNDGKFVAQYMDHQEVLIEKKGERTLR